MRISDWSSDVCSSDLTTLGIGEDGVAYHQCYRSAGSSRCDGVGKEKRLRRARRGRGLCRGVNPRYDLVRGKSLLFVGEATTKRDADTVAGAKGKLRNNGVTVLFYSAPAGNGRQRCQYRVQV